jgi:imidazoleglycerol phosphate dehydratase HisB
MTSPAPAPAPRRATFERTTSETRLAATIDLDAPGPARIATGIGFLDHMLQALARHARIGLIIEATGDLHIDDHHTAEDCAIALGACLDRALGERRGIARFASAYAPLDESLARAVIDLSGRAHATINLGLNRERLGDIACENITHFFITLAANCRAAIHLDLIRGENDHHKAEAAFKAFALALRQAIALDQTSDEIPSTKGALR